MEEIKLERAVFEFSQEENGCSTDMGGIETLIVECTSDMGITRSEGAFYVLKTEQWAVNGIEDLRDLFNRIEKAIGAVK